MKAQLRKQSKAHELSATVGLDFQQKLAVLSAGSIAVVASGTAAMLSFHASHPQFGKGAFPCIAVSSSALFLSLILSVSYNLAAAAISTLRAKVVGKQSAVMLCEFVLANQVPPTPRDDFFAANPTLKKDADELAMRAIRGEARLKYLGFTAVIFFALGYLAVVVLICLEAQLI